MTSDGHPKPTVLLETIPQFRLRVPGMSAWSIYNHLTLGNLQAVKIGKQTLIRVPEALEWLSSLPAAKINMAQRTPAKSLPARKAA